MANKMKSIVIDENGMFDPSIKRERKLEGLFAQNIAKYNQCHGPGGKFCSGGSSGGGGGGASLSEQSDAPPVIVGDVAVQPGMAVSPLQDKKFVKPENLTNDEYVALRQYGGTEYAVLNSRLRNQDPKEWPEKAHWMTQNIDSAIAKQEPLKAPMKVYRGSDYSRLFGKKKPEELIGAKITDKGFMSTSASSEVAERFGGTRFTITLPAGYKALDMAKNTGTVAARSEREMLLPRGTQYEITHVTQTKGGFLGVGKKTYIEARVITPVMKYNQCHGAGGKFCSGGSGGGGGSGGFQKLPEELNQDELAAIESYADTGFKAMNNALRGKEPMTPELQSKITAMDSAMAKQPLTKNTTVYRGIKSQKFLGGEVKDPKSLIGAVLTDPGFMSTSANSQTAASFSIGKGGVLMQIAVNAGTAALNIRDHVFTDQAFEEHEVLIHRNSKMKITRAEKVGEQLRLSAEVIS